MLTHSLHFHLVHVLPAGEEWVVGGEQWCATAAAATHGAAAEAELSTLVNFIWRMAVESLVRRWCSSTWSVGRSVYLSSKGNVLPQPRLQHGGC